MGRLGILLASLNDFEINLRVSDLKWRVLIRYSYYGSSSIESMGELGIVSYLKLLVNPNDLQMNPRLSIVNWVLYIALLFNNCTQVLYLFF